MTGDQRGIPHYLSRKYERTLADVLQSVETLTEEELRHRPAHTNSIAFNVWHLARWADHLASILPEMTPGLGERLGSTPELWVAEGLQRRWGFPSQLGQAETGMELDPARVPWLAPAESYGPVLSWVLAYTRHDDRHLGMIEALKGSGATS